MKKSIFRKSVPLRSQRRIQLYFVGVVAVFFLFLLLFLLSSCAAPTTGTITGQTSVSGGPVSFDGDGQTPVRPMGGTEVVASPVGGDGSKAWSVTTGDDGLFSIEVPPGTYTIGAYVDGGHGGYIGPQLVIVKVGEKVEVNLALRFP